MASCGGCGRDARGGSSLAEEWQTLSPPTVAIARSLQTGLLLARALVRKNLTAFEAGAERSATTRCRFVEWLVACQVNPYTP